MFIIVSIILLISNAVIVIRDKSKLFVRLLTISLLYIICLSYSNFNKNISLLLYHDILFVNTSSYIIISTAQVIIIISIIIMLQFPHIRPLFYKYLFSLLFALIASYLFKSMFNYFSLNTDITALDLEGLTFVSLVATFKYIFLIVYDSIFPHTLSMDNNSLPSQQTGGVPSQQTGGVPSRQTGGVPSQQTGGVPSQHTGEVPSQQAGAAPPQLVFLLQTRLSIANTESFEAKRALVLSTNNLELRLRNGESASNLIDAFGAMNERRLRLGNLLLTKQELKNRLVENGSAYEWKPRAHATQISEFNRATTLITSNTNISANTFSFR